MKLGSDAQKILFTALVPFGCLIWLAWVCADDWNHDPNYSHGWFIVPLFLYFLWQRWERAAPGLTEPARPLSAWWLAPVPFLIFGIELVRLAPFFWRPIPWLIFFLGSAVTVFLAYRCLGRGSWRILSFPLLFLATSIPWPTFFEVEVVRHFSFFIAAVVGEILLLGGIFNQVSGRVIQLADGSVGVDEACSGLRSLQASLMIALAGGEWFLLSIRRRLALVLAGVVLALLLNIFRAWLLAWLVATTGTEAFTRWHDPIGLFLLLSLTGLILGAGWFLHGRGEELEPVPTDGVARPCLWGGRGVRGLSVACLTGFMAAHSWYVWNDRSHSPPAAFIRGEDWMAGSSIELPPPEVADILRADSGGYIILPGMPPDAYSLYHFFWEADRTNGKVLFHRPDVCMPGAGWVQQGAADLFPGSLNGRPVVIHRFLFERAPFRVSLLWICWVDDQPLSFSGKAHSYLQLSFVPEFIRLGRRVFSVEIMGLVTTASVDEAGEIGRVLASCGRLVFIPSAPDA